jgi:hypothetical protein
VIEDGDLSLYLPMDSDMRDYISSYDVTDNTGTMSNVTGQINNGTYFGRGNYSIVGDIRFSNSTLEDFSLCFWYSLDVESSGTQYIISAGRENTGKVRGFHFSSQADAQNLISFVTADGADNVDTATITSTLLDDESFNHICGVRNSSDVTLFVNGVLNKSTATSDIQGSDDTGVGLRLAAGTANPTVGIFVGALDEVMFYNRSLTYNEISILYDGTKNNFGVFDSSDTSSGSTYVCGVRAVDATEQSSWTNSSSLYANLDRDWETKTPKLFFVPSYSILISL